MMVSIRQGYRMRCRVADPGIIAPMGAQPEILDSYSGQKRYCVFLVVI